MNLKEMVCEDDLSGSGQGPAAGSNEHGFETTGCMKGGKLAQRLSAFRGRICSMESDVNKTFSGVVSAPGRPTTCYSTRVEAPPDYSQSSLKIFF
jgi:hypothetical protein